jgi:hypothetical protein
MYKSRLSAIIFLLLSLSCENLYLPDIGVPLNVPNPRATPAGVISQLFQSYETRRIELFTDLLSNDFKFYIAAGFEKTMTNQEPLSSEKPDAFMHHVNENTLYYYWGYKSEIDRTSKLFSNAEMIDIPSRPEISDILYSSFGDTSFAELLVKDVTFEVSKYENSNTLVTYSLENQPQVFLLERTTDSLWVIKKWFDLGSE